MSVIAEWYVLDLISALGISIFIVSIALWIFFLRKRIKTLRKSREKISEDRKKHCLIDSLTGLYNYKYFVRRLREIISQAQRMDQPFSLLKLNIDIYKSINTIYGRLEGDNILKQFADFLDGITRVSDIVARLGGDEFGMMLAFTDTSGALKAARRIKQSLRFRSFGSNNKKINLNVSVGIVTFPQDSLSDISLLSHLDRCILKSKQYAGKVITAKQLCQTDANSDCGANSYNVEELKQRVLTLEAMLGRTIVESIVAFANTIKAKDLYTAKHTSKTVNLALDIGRKLYLTSERLTLLRYATLLHDLGKVGISEKILKKPAKLTIGEFEEIKKHPLIGVEILRPLHELSDIIPIILHHHERIDGKGYPHGLKDGQIPLEAKILAVADSFQALTSDRVYRRAYSPRKAMSIIEEESGTHFDPLVVTAFKASINHHPRIK